MHNSPVSYVRSQFSLPLRSLSIVVLILWAWTACAQITPSQDSFTNSTDMSTNYGANVLLDVDGSKETAYIQFNLASIPSGAIVSQATLKLYVNAVTTAGSFNVDYVKGSWSEGTITYSTAPALGTTIASGVTITAADKNQYILIDITPAVQEWLNASQANDGIALVPNGTFEASFDSKENKTTSHPPELDIVFAGSGGGGITGITTASGSGLIGGGTSGVLNLSLTNVCATNQVLQWSGTAWICAAVGTGTITGVTAGTDLTGGGSSGNVTLSLNTAATNALYAQLAANNTFSGIQTVNNTTFITGANSSGALQVTNTLVSGSAPAVNGTTNSTDASAVRGNAVATTGTSNGVLGSASSSQGFGVAGSSPNVGVHGTSDGASRVGVGVAQTGVWGDAGGSSGPDGPYTGVWGTADNSYAGQFVNNSANYTTLFLLNLGTGGTGAVLVTEGQSGICSIDGGGDLGCTGKMSSAVPVGHGARKVEIYPMQSPENWFEDFGSGALINGAATVALDPIFAQTVNTTTEYHVFLTAKGDSEGLFVSNETPYGFEVHEQRGGRSSVAFDYRIVAKRAGSEHVRLADVTEKYQKMEAQEQLRLERMAQRRSPPSAAAHGSTATFVHK